jgi:uncharacterized protein (TIGR02246 family)
MTRAQFYAHALQFKINDASFEHFFVEVLGRFAGFGFVMRECRFGAHRNVRRVNGLQQCSRSRRAVGQPGRVRCLRALKWRIHKDRLRASTAMMRRQPPGCTPTMPTSSVSAAKWQREGKRFERGLAAILSTRAKNASLDTRAVAIRFIRPDVALVHVTNELRGLVNSEGQTLPAHHELSLRVFVKESGVWRVAAFQNTLTRPFEASSTGQGAAPP